MKIVIETIDHKDQRYTTVGDWFYDPDGTLHIKVSKLSEKKREWLIAVHELVEVLTCQLDGVSQERVDKFDKWFEENRPEGNDEEPGDDVDAPYRRQHCLATGIERILAERWDVRWKDYEDELENLPEVEPK
jgi:hypothetical protein